jgi:hypothetical protein
MQTPPARNVVAWRSTALVQTIAGTACDSSTLNCDMPRFYLDVRDGERLFEDPDGDEYSGIDEAREEASLALIEMMKDARADDRRELAIEVRDEDSRLVLRVRIALDVEAVETEPLEAMRSASSRSARLSRG